ncbi:MAG TPA: response regulator transcription factor [Lacunisphaera sp.]|nr:response regulator transcription factor [Lacunisphaera sp.]
MRKAPPPAASAARVRQRVLVVEDHPVMRESLVESINRTKHLCVCAACSTMAGALRQLEKAAPHIIITDLSLGNDQGFAFIEMACSRHPAIPLLVFSMHSEAIHAPRVFRCGAAGYVMKGEGYTCLMAAVCRVLAGGLAYADRVRPTLLRQFAVSGGAPSVPLNEEERLVFTLTGRGVAPAIIADTLGLTAARVAEITAALRDKLHLATDIAVTHCAQLIRESGAGTSPPA